MTNITRREIEIGACGYLEDDSVTRMDEYGPHEQGEKEDDGNGEQPLVYLGSDDKIDNDSSGDWHEYLDELEEHCCNQHETSLVCGRRDSSAIVLPASPRRRTRLESATRGECEYDPSERVREVRCAYTPPTHRGINNVCARRFNMFKNDEVI